MNAFIIAIVVGAAAIAGGYAWRSESLTQNAPAAATSTVPAPFSDDIYKRAAVSLNGHRFSALVADSPTLEEKGLGGRRGLGKDEGMLFVFDEPNQVGFWMKDMLFPIDIVWIGEDFRIATIAQNVPPESYPKAFYPNRSSKYVFEIPAGTIEKIGAKEGDLAEIKL